MKNKRIIFIILGIIVIMALGICLMLFNHKKEYDINDVESFKYYSGSSGYAVSFEGEKNNNSINVQLIEYSGATQTSSEYVISLNEFKKLLKLTKVENCEKQSYEHQCGEADGCSSSSFSVKYKTEEKNVCYVPNDDIAEFFENLKKDKSL